ncbi:Holliday junction resolvase RuvX [Dialister sp.]|uniref:Holliday junction resolvase RuvX n=1 Tax=Dialister sp. TaxID=1955814 RepID=UPI003EFCEB32
MIIAVDPGKDKTGCAVVEEDGSLIFKKVIPTLDYEKEVAALLSRYPVRAFIMGNGTRHNEMKDRSIKLLKTMERNIPVVLVDEKYTTEMGEQWYWKDHPARGFQRLIPKGMRTIPVPVDDYVAWIIGNIYLGFVKAEDVGHKKV